jgi:hypothetical protein
VDEGAYVFITGRHQDLAVRSALCRRQRIVQYL